MTTAELNKKFDAFWNNFKGKTIDTDGFPEGKVYQCVDVAKYWAHSLGVAYGSFGNAIKYWYDTAPALKKKFTRLDTTVVKKGDIVVLETNTTPIKPGKGYGHIGLATGKQTSTTFDLLEQNGSTGNGLGKSGDKIRVRSIPKKRIAGVLRPIVSTAPTTVSKKAYDAVVKQRDQLKKTVDTQTQKIKELTKIVTTLQKENVSLKSQVGDSTKWQTLKSLLRELLS